MRIETAPADFPGPRIAVSHDRWLIERFVGQVWELRDRRLIQHQAPAALVLQPRAFGQFVHECIPPVA